ncbi:hypothetical protein S245_040898 [Arachis hypogaea]
MPLSLPTFAPLSLLSSVAAVAPPTLIFLRSLSIELTRTIQGLVELLSLWSLLLLRVPYLFAVIASSLCGSFEIETLFSLFCSRITKHWVLDYCYSY